MAPKLAIVIPNYNGERYVGETIQSLLGQTYRDFEIIFVDNKSTDGSIGIARTFVDSRLRIECANEHLPLTGNWNRCISMVATPYFLLGHADDIYEARYVEVLVSALERHSGACFAHCRAKTIDGEGREFWSPNEQFKNRFWPDEAVFERGPEPEYQVLSQGNYIVPPSVLFRTEAVHAIGPFSDEYQMAPDWHYWFRTLFSGYSYVGVRERLVRYRRHRGMATQSHESTLRRYKEEASLIEWSFAEGARRGWSKTEGPDYTLVLNTMLSDFATCLRRGDQEQARVILKFARERIPEFAKSFRNHLMAIAMSGGKVSGYLLKYAERLFLTLKRSKIR